jgi:pimeloyl-ACP methyl ester carboxylesterase
MKPWISCGWVHWTMVDVGDLTGRRIIVVPGMKPKPPPDIHRRELWRVLLAGIERADDDLAQALRRQPEIFDLVSWTYDFYASYRDIGLDLPGIEHALETRQPAPRDIDEIESLNRKVQRWVHIVGDAFPFLIRWLAKPDIRLTMGEARRYLHDRNGVATKIRAKLVAALQDAWQREQTVMLIGHSLGSVIAYDALWHLTHEQGQQHSVDTFMTLGSPLATRFIRNQLLGAGLQGAARYPHNIKHWLNFSARGEMTAIHVRLKPTFGEMLDLGLLETFDDHADFYNFFRGDTGLNVHKSYGYLLSPGVVAALVGWLRSSAGSS